MVNPMTLQEQKQWVNVKIEKFMRVVRGDVDDMKLEEILDIMDEFYLLTRVPKKWSSLVHHKCSCVDSFRDGICHHAVLLAMIADDRIVIPPAYCKLHVAARRKRGRPAVDPEIVEAMAECDARVRARGAAPPQPTIAINAAVTTYSSDEVHDLNVQREHAADVLLQDEGGSARMSAQRRCRASQASQDTNPSQVLKYA